MTDLDIIKECRQTGKTRTTTKNLLEKAYYEQMTKEIDISRVLIEGDTATIMGEKYKRVEEPKRQTLKDIILEWIVIYNIRSDSVRDRITADLLERIETKWFPCELEGAGEEYYMYHMGWNTAIKTLKDRLR